MTNRELIEKLKKLPQGASAWVITDDRSYEVIGATSDKQESFIFIDAE